jgi:hypothetical protein
MGTADDPVVIEDSDKEKDDYDNEKTILTSPEGAQFKYEFSCSQKM